MKERVKSFFLVFLVLLSLFMTYRLWFVPQRMEEVSDAVFEPVFTEEPRPFSEIVTPRCFIMHRDQNVYYFGVNSFAYNYLWEGVTLLMIELYPRNYRISELLPEDGNILLTVSFSPELPIGSGTAWFQEEHYAQLAAIEFWESSRGLYTVFKDETNEAVFTAIIDPDYSAALERLMGELPLDGEVTYKQLNPADLFEISGVEIFTSDFIYVPSGNLVLDDILLKREYIESDLLVNTFFLDRSLVREIAEKDGSVIYTDGEKGLRLSSGLEYSFPQLEQEPATATYAAALNTAGRLLSRHGGWPEGLRLDDLSLTRMTNSRQPVYCVSWRMYFQGLPIAGKTAGMLFNDGGMVEYKRDLYVPLVEIGDPALVAGYDAAIDAALYYLRLKEISLKDPLLLEKLDLVYAVGVSRSQLLAYPVWQIRLAGHNLVLDARSLAVLEEVQL